MIILWEKSRKRTITFFIGMVLFLAITSCVCADVVVNILSVNGSEDVKEAEISSKLPKEIAVEDVLDTAGLK